MKNYRVGIIAACICATGVLGACAPLENNTDNDSVVLEESSANPPEPTDIPNGGEVVDANIINNHYRGLGHIEEFTARLENGRVVQCITWLKYDDAGGQSCIWEENNTVINTPTTVTSTVTVSPTPQ